MLADNFVVLGIDLRNGYYQMSFFHEGMNEPKMLLMMDEKSPDFELSAYIFLDPVSGERIVDFSKISTVRTSLKPEYIVRNIFFDDVEGSGFDRQTLIAMFIRNCFVILADNVSNRQVAALCFTSRFADPNIQGEIRRAVDMLDLRGCKLFFEDYMESFYHYLIRQKKTAFDDRAVVFYRWDDEIIMGSLVFRNRLLENSVSSNEDASLSLPVYLDFLKKDAGFAQFIHNRLLNLHISSVFVVTDDLDLVSMPETKRALSDKGHIFAGNNLFVQGAAYSAFDRDKGVENRESYLGNDRIKYDIYIEARCNKRMQKVVLASAEQKYYEVNTTLDVIAKDRDKFVFHTRSLETSKIESFELVMNGIPSRPDYTTRLRINLSFANISEFMIEVQDLGFGGVFPTSGLIFKDVFELGS